MAGAAPTLIELPADDPDRARRFWGELLGLELDPRRPGEGEGWQTHDVIPAVGVHPRGRGPGDTFSLPYFEVGDMEAALETVRTHGGAMIHPGSEWSICKDTEGTPFGLHQPAQAR